uniref:Uncharacterized protein n=1 Tax=Rhizophagus irregularis (strain DAOM 181602 / DAOM 197198 / MUCL 43194) TaxID=747089 RepID=U9UJY0_RHIID
MCFLAPQAKIELKPLVKTLNFINEKTPSIPSGMVANRYLGLRGDLNIAIARCLGLDLVMVHDATADIDI